MPSCRFKSFPTAASLSAAMPGSSQNQAQDLFAEQIRLLFQNQPYSLLANIINATLFAYVIRDYFSARVILAWLLTVYLVGCLRIYGVYRYRRLQPAAASARVWGRRFVAGVFANGVLWGIAGGLLVPESSYLHELFMAFVLAGMSAGAMSSNSSYKPAYVAYLVPALLPYCLRVSALGGEIFSAMSIMVVLFVVMMWLLCERHHLSIIESLRLRYENAALLDNLSVSVAEQKRANDELRLEIVERERTQQALRTSDNFYRTLVETTGIGYHLLDAHGSVIDANQGYIGLTGRKCLADIKCKPVFDWIAAHDQARAREEIALCLKVGYIRNAELDYVDELGRITPVEINATLLNDSGVPQLLSLARDITERREAEMALRRAYGQSEQLVAKRTIELKRANDTLSREKEKFRVTLASIVDAVITTDAADRVTFLNSAAARLTGWREDEAIGEPLRRVFRLQGEDPGAAVTNGGQMDCDAGDNITPFNQYLLARNHDTRAIECSVAPICDSHGVAIGSVLSFRDVTKQRKLAEQLSHQATHDKLTGLVNRHEFERRLLQSLRSAAPNNPHALLYLDLDQFKVVNDTCGHSAGDELLKRISGLFQANLRSRDTLARLGGDEFGIILERCTLNEAHRVAQALREVVQTFRFGWQDRSFSLSVSIGLVPIVSVGETLESAMSAADSACYTAKDRGRDRVHIYQFDDSEVARRDSEMRWMPRIQQALQDDRFCLYFQPIRAVGRSSKGEVHGEILVRMIDEEGRIVPPGAFLPAAERYGQMLALDRWVVSHSLAALAAQAKRGHSAFYAINLSAQSVGTPEFHEFVDEELRLSGIPPDRICFEITETAAISELTQVLAFIDNLKARGCRFALDDFGTGLASFSYLKTLPVDFLKIDGTFVKDLVSDDIDEAMVEAINNIGHVMGLSTIAEWVETDSTLHRLHSIGVDFAQGYALGAPTPLLGEQIPTPA